MQHKSNYQDLLKCFAILAMIVDHIGLYIFPENSAMRLLGRCAMPIFCFFAGYNFNGLPKLKIFIWGVGLYIITTCLLRKFTPTNILISIFLGQCYLYLCRNKLQNIHISYVHLFMLWLLSIVTINFFDYGTLVIAVMMLGFIASKHSEYLKIAILFSIALPMLSSTFLIFNFTGLYIHVLIFLAILEYFIMTLIKFDKKILLNINIISRNSLYIYVVHLIILQAIFVYYIQSDKF